MAESKRLADLIAASAYAPTYGLNSRELLLQAARLRNVEEDFTFKKKAQSGPAGRPQPGQGQLRNAPATGESAATLFIHAESLCTGIPVKETPSVGWNPKSKVPRGERLSVLRRLVGEHLALELHAEGLPLIPDSVARYDTVRHRAIARAIQQEESEIYKLCTGRPSYIALAARVSARPPSLPAANLTAVCTGPSAWDASPAPATLREELFGSPEPASPGPSEESPPYQGVSPERGRKDADACTDSDLDRSQGDPTSDLGTSAMPDNDISAAVAELARGFVDDSGMRDDDEAGPGISGDIVLPSTSDRVQIEGVGRTAELPFSLVGSRAADVSDSGDREGSDEGSGLKYPVHAPGSGRVLLPFDLSISPAELLDAILKATGGVSTPAAQPAEAPGGPTSAADAPVAPTSAAQPAEAPDASTPAAEAPVAPTTAAQPAEAPDASTPDAEAQRCSGPQQEVLACELQSTLHATEPDRTIPSAAPDRPTPTGGPEVTEPGLHSRKTSLPAAWDQAASSTGLGQERRGVDPDEAPPALGLSLATPNARADNASSNAGHDNATPARGHESAFPAAGRDEQYPATAPDQELVGAAADQGMLPSRDDSTSPADGHDSATPGAGSQESTLAELPGQAIPATVAARALSSATVDKATILHGHDQATLATGSDQPTPAPVAGQAVSIAAVDQATGATPPDEATLAAVPNEGVQAGGTDRVPQVADVHAKEAGAAGLPAGVAPSGVGSAAPVAVPGVASPSTPVSDVIPPNGADEAQYVPGVGAEQSTLAGSLVDQAILPALGAGVVPEAGVEAAVLPVGLDSGVCPGLRSSGSTFNRSILGEKQGKGGDRALQEDTGLSMGQGGAQARTFGKEAHADLGVCGVSRGVVGEVAARDLPESGHAHVDLDAVGHAGMDASATFGRVAREGRKRQRSQEAAHKSAAQSTAKTAGKEPKRRRSMSEARSTQRADRVALGDHRKREDPSVPVVPGYEIPDDVRKRQHVTQFSVPAAAAVGLSAMPDVLGTPATGGHCSFHGPTEHSETGGGWVAPSGAYVDAGGSHVQSAEAPHLLQEAIPPPPPGFVPPLTTEALPPLPPEPPEWENMGAGIHGGGGTSIGGAVSRAVGDAVLRYVRSILDPLYAAEVITKDVYKKVAKKAVDKVMRSHADAPDAMFLVREGGRIQVLVQQYVELYMSQPAPPG